MHMIRRRNIPKKKKNFLRLFVRIPHMGWEAQRRNAQNPPQGKMSQLKFLFFRCFGFFWWGRGVPNFLAERESGHTRLSAVSIKKSSNKARTCRINWQFSKLGIPVKR